MENYKEILEGMSLSEILREYESASEATRSYEVDSSRYDRAVNAMDDIRLELERRIGENA